MLTAQNFRSLDVNQFVSLPTQLGRLSLLRTLCDVVIVICLSLQPGRVKCVARCSLLDVNALAGSLISQIGLLTALIAL